MMEKAIKKFQKMTKLFPERIFFYRDGICENQKDVEGILNVAQI
jgi:hypothetical protein